MFGLNKNMILIIIVIAIIFMLTTGFSISKLFSSKARKEVREQKIEEKEEKRKIENTLQESSVFKKEYLNYYSESYQLNGEQANDLVKKIKFELTFWGGRPTKMNNYFSSLTHSVQVAQLSYLYSAKYNRSMVTDIVDYMTKKQIVDLYNIIKSLPR